MTAGSALDVRRFLRANGGAPFGRAPLASFEPGANRRTSDYASRIAALTEAQTLMQSDSGPHETPPLPVNSSTTARRLCREPPEPHRRTYELHIEVSRLIPGQPRWAGAELRVVEMAGPPR